MSDATLQLTERERELGAIIDAYNKVTEQLKRSHDELGAQVQRLREELNRKNEQLRRRERLAALGEMAAGVAHEIRNPLGGIQVFASLLERDLSDRPAEQQMVKKIGRCVGSLESIVSDILEFGRPSAPNPMPLDLAALLEELTELTERKARASRVTIEIEDALREVELITDAGLLRRALLNLVLNGIEAAASGSGAAPAVVIGLAGQSEDWIGLSVADSGPGIQPEDRDRIFNPFFTTKDEGVGLGLAIVHQIAETLGGGVAASNRAGGGAVFTLRLPRRLVVEQAALCEPHPADGDTSGLTGEN